MSRPSHVQTLVVLISVSSCPQYERGGVEVRSSPASTKIRSQSRHKGFEGSKKCCWNKEKKSCGKDDIPNLLFVSCSLLDCQLVFLVGSFTN